MNKEHRQKYIEDLKLEGYKVGKIGNTLVASKPAIKVKPLDYKVIDEDGILRDSAGKVIKKQELHLINGVREATRDYFAPIIAIYNYLRRRSK